MAAEHTEDRRAGEDRALPGEGARNGGSAPGYVAAEGKQQLLTRLRRVEGQVRGLARMVEEDAYCIDVLTQVSAATRALQGVALELLDDHVHHCVAEGIRTGDDEKITEAMEAITRLVRTS